MKHEELTEKVKDIMASQEEMTAQEIHAQIEGVAIIQIHRVLKELINKRKAVLIQQEKVKKYALIEHTNVRIDKGGRDVSTYTFQGEQLRKGLLALIIMCRAMYNGE